MKTLLFVHGTGVREHAFSATKLILQNELASRPIVYAGYQLQGCYWGSDCGVKLPPEPKSIPDYFENEQPSPSAVELTKWVTLSCDPFFELRELVRQDGRWEPQGAERTPPCVGMTEVIGAIVVDGPLKALLERHLLTQAFQAIIEDLAKHGMLISLCAQLKAQPRTITMLFSRMIVAQTMMKAAADSQVQLDSSTRDSLVLVLIDLIGGRAGAVKEVFGAALSVVWPLLGPGIRLATTAMRSDLTNGGSPVAGDIVAYQGHRGARFRERILTEIQNAPTDEVVLLAHSLGGIACVDLLIEKKVNEVTHLITVGSQSPFLYEIDSLGSLRYGSPLPDHFPRNWLNVYDRHDILAYKADGVFPSSPHVFVQDVDVDGRVPFPQAHGAYWANGELWSAMEGFLKRP